MVESEVMTYLSCYSGLTPLDLPVTEYWFHNNSKENNICKLL
jgi:hypothetical protein